MHNIPEKYMIAFEIQDMTCGHCREAIARAVLGVDSAAKVEVDLALRHVHIESAEVGAQSFGDAIAAAGYSPRRMTERAATSRSGGCSCSGAGAVCGMRVSDFTTAADTAPRRSGPQAEPDARPVTGACCCSGSDASCSA
jgi:copper chaperone